MLAVVDSQFADDKSQAYRIDGSVEADFELQALAEYIADYFVAVWSELSSAVDCNS